MFQHSRLSYFFSVAATLLCPLARAVKILKTTNMHSLSRSLSLRRRQMVSTEVMSEASLLFLERADVRDPSVQTFQASLFRIIIYVFTIKHIQLQRKTLIFPRCELL